jgi:hypothetical protein
MLEATQAYAAALLTLFSESFLRAGARCLVGDQAMLNYAVYHHLIPWRIKIWKNGEAAYNLGTHTRPPNVACINGSCGWVLADEGKLPALLHQYPALPGVAAVALHRIVQGQYASIPQGSDRELGGRGRGGGATSADGGGGEFPPLEVEFSLFGLMKSLFPAVDDPSIQTLIARATAAFPT